MEKAPRGPIPTPLLANQNDPQSQLKIKTEESCIKHHINFPTSHPQLFLIPFINTSVSHMEFLLHHHHHHYHHRCLSEVCFGNVECCTACFETRMTFVPEGCMTFLFSSCLLDGICIKDVLDIAATMFKLLSVYHCELITD